MSTSFIGIVHQPRALTDSVLRVLTLQTTNGDIPLALTAKLASGKLTIVVDISKKGVPSSTGKTLLHVNTGGYTNLPLEIDGKPARLNMMVTTPNQK